MAVKNTTDESLTLDKALTEAFEEKGYRVVSNPNKAHYWLQANILKVGKMSQSASELALGGGYGSVLMGAGTGAALGSLTSYQRGALVGGVAGGVLGLASDSLVKNVNYTVITDVQISERVGKGVVKESYNANLSQGLSSNLNQTSTKDSQFKRYRTRVVSTANQVNLSFAKARAPLESGLTRTLVGIF